jgi:isoleucyl-tRNA synthetase
MFKAISPKVNVNQVEQEVQEFWRLHRIFERTMAEREGGERFVFYEGPPTANGQPGSHHVLARSFKDLFPRYKTMRGYYCLRKGGWDTHGLPVEIAVQKELGITNKREVEAYGIAEFNKKCRDSVFRNIAEWEKLTERTAYWVNLDEAYVTFTNEYIESVWWVLRQLWDKNLIYQGYKVVPYCTQCGTPLSSHEVAQGYDTVKDPSVFVRFPVQDKQGVYFLVWTTTPWTLPGNVALAIGADVNYVQVEGPASDGEGTEQLILAEALMSHALKDPENYRVVKKMKGKDLVGMHYNPLYTFLPVEGQDYAYVVAGDFVSTTDGTGIVHIAPAFGEDDMAVGKKYDLPVLMTVNSEGKFIDAVTKFRGKWFKDADPEITRDLRERGLMYKVEQYEHNYPFCWRDNSPLMYLARETWYIRTTEYRDRMVAGNQTINWVPEHTKDGRFGDWLDNLKDWALGRERYWGTPLPIWIDDQTGDMLCVGSVAELSKLAGRDLSELELHRPYVDDIVFRNPNGGGMMRRVPEVIDVWFDSGAMPIAQWGYPQKNHDLFESQYPADYISEAIDQTRGWFYTLHAISTMLFDQPAFKNVISLGHILDEKGRKMSKSLGNIVDPWAVLNEHGADAFRWYLYTASPPGESRRFSVNLVGDVIKKFWLTLWNTYSFFVTYANLDGWTPNTPVSPVAERDLLDKWLLSELHNLTRRVTNGYENFDVTEATRPVQVFVESLSNWYVRLSRARFWKSEKDADKMNAYATLYECLVTVSKLIAPAMPFLSESMYRNLVSGVDKSAPDSVHLAFWADYDESLINEELMKEMDLVQRLVSLGLAARNNNKEDGKNVPIGVRQPLQSVQFGLKSADEAGVVTKYTDLITSELNVKSLGVLDADAQMVTYALNPLPAQLGKKLGKDFPKVQKMMREGEAEQVKAWALALKSGQNVAVTVDDVTYDITPEECLVVQNATAGYSVGEEKGYLAALDVRLTSELLQEGLAREVVRRIQTLRKDADFDISDHITVVYEAEGNLAEAISKFADYIKGETLAKSLVAGKVTVGFYKGEYLPNADPKKDDSIRGESLVLGVKKA